MRVVICDMVTIARFLNVTLFVPELDQVSFWADPRLNSKTYLMWITSSHLSEERFG